MFSPFVQLRIYFKIWLLQRAVRALEAKAVKPAVVQNTPDPSPIKSPLRCSPDPIKNDEPLPLFRKQAGRPRSKIGVIR